MAKASAVIVLEQRLVKSAVWLSLSGTAKSVYLLFRTKCRVGKPPGKPGKRDWMILNNGELVFTYREALSKYGTTASRFRRALDELIEKGFIDVEAAGMGVHKVTTLYAISERWRDYGTPAFRPAKRPTPSIRNPGFKRGNKLWRRASKKNASVENAHGAVRDNESAEVVTVQADVHGDKETFFAQGAEKQAISRQLAREDCPNCRRAQKRHRSIGSQSLWGWPWRGSTGAESFRVMK